MHLTPLPADIEALKKSVSELAELLRATGVGGLPLLPIPSDPNEVVMCPSEDELMNVTERSVQMLYNKLRGKQELAETVVNLLTAQDRK
jgi:hypothetical protein